MGRARKVHEQLRRRYRKGRDTGVQRSPKLRTRLSVLGLGLTCTGQKHVLMRVTHLHVHAPLLQAGHGDCGGNG